MAKFKVNITETLSRTIEVEAESKSDAKDMVRAIYDNEDLVLDYSDFEEVEIKIVDNE